MEQTPSREQHRSESQFGADLSRERLPRPTDPTGVRWAGYDSASSAEVVERHERNQAAREKRSRRASAQTSERLHRDGIIARVWHAAAGGDPKVAPEVRKHFGRCVESCLANEAVTSFLAARLPGWSEATLRANPIIRVEFDHAFVLGRLGESLGIARRKAWDTFLGVQPLDTTDPIDPVYVIYAFKESAPYQVRFEQRGRLRRILGKGYAPLVVRAMRSGKKEFLGELTEDQAARIRARTGLEPGRFWRAAKGGEIIDWPEPPRQLTFFDLD